jgi:hypothetical protein
MRAVRALGVGGDGGADGDLGLVVAVVNADRNSGGVGVDGGDVVLGFGQAAQLGGDPAARTIRLCVILLVLGLATGSAGYAVLSPLLHALVAHH